MVTMDAAVIGKSLLEVIKSTCNLSNGQRTKSIKWSCANFL